ncbi:hypothetical protein DOM22_00565 [Bdellovibrio sp. ZAP7]|uniref:hypothetical protein n=1 Tax=Bdellovibrio sp. ZAP7 TaxID=2231053 RepID=UPI00115BA371|nr:hypothetical protein [Bdellovibrio sp. ZAP7]QDK43763.1 hypothetical protein DOM22_00565 [Bdellovibrio sp. ZAP7]
MNLVKHLSLVAVIYVTATALSVQAAAPSKQFIIPMRSTVAAPQVQAPKFKSYREWKTEMVSTAQMKVTYLKTQIDSKKMNRRAASGTDPNLARGRNNLEAVASQDISVEKMEKQLREEQYDLEVAKDLSVTDYFAGYLTKVPDKKAAFKEVAGKLSPEEVAELMNAYANSVFGAHASDLPVSATNTSKESVR